MRTIPRRTAVKIIYWNLVIAVLAVSLAGVAYIRRIHRFDDLIVQISREHQVDSRLVAAVIWRESRFNPDRVGTHNEVGLMQVMESSAREWAHARGIRNFSRHDLFDPTTNIQAGVWYLTRAIGRWSDYDDPLPFALAEYNAGRSNAQRWAENCEGNSRKFWNNITYPTTKRYVKDILKRYRGRV